jgi:phthiocerol/phenolphthiocerol synthesis type-I polyketide synthase E
VSETDIAVIGMAGRFPGSATVDEFWTAIRTGTVGLRRFTDAEVAAAGVPDAERTHPDHVPVGGALDDIECFDAGLFGYPPREAALLDPQHRLFLECAWHALEDAGHCAGGRENVVGVYASASMNTYLPRHLLGNPAVLGGLTPLDLMLGNDKDSLATRVAYHLDLTGPAVAVQTACSSSLVAVHLAAQALLGGDCDIALAGGVSVRPPLHEGYRYQQGGILAPDGRCLPFDADARGVVPGNGVAAVVLRPLADALADGDTVLAVLKGTAVNNDGAAKVGFTAPSVTGQADVISAALTLSGVAPSTIGYVEAHGTATPLGDPIEVAALTRVFGEHATDCALGSVKSLIGHLDAAAGVAGFVKAVLAVRHGILPPSPYFREPNPETGLADSPFTVHPQARPWPAEPRRAGVSSFGMGGTNAHAVLEQPPAAEPSGPSRPRQLLVLAAADVDALAEARSALAARLAEPDGPSLADVAHTLRVGRRTTHAHRLATVCADRADAVAVLTEPGGSLWSSERDVRRPVVFLFPGQGAQYAGMAEDLRQTEPVFRVALDECAALFAPHLGADLGALLRDGADLDRTRFTQPALFAVEYSLATLWRHWGVRPDAMLGHSIGEYTAACLAGVLSLPDATALVAARGELMDRLPGGAMLAVSAAADDLVLPEGVCLAASNASAMSTVAGPAPAIGRFAAELAERGVRTRELRTSHAFHSAMIDPMLPAFAEHLAGVTMRAPRIPFCANVTGDWITPEQATDPEYWLRHTRAAVRFSEGLRTLLADGPTILLEVGPGTTLATLARQHDLSDSGHTVLTSLRHPRERRHDLETMLAALGRLWLAGADVDLTRPTADERRRRVPLPGYPFRRDRHWVDLPGTTPVDHPAPAATISLPVPVGPPDEVTRIVSIWQELLGIPVIGPDADFFELGGHSLLATQIQARVAEALGVPVPADAIFRAPTPAGLAALVAAVRPEPAAEDEMDRLLTEIRQMSNEQLRAELDRERDAREIPLS